jgi:TonB family protein
MIAALAVVGAIVLAGNKTRGTSPAVQTVEAPSDNAPKGGAISEPASTPSKAKSVAAAGLARRGGRESGGNLASDGMVKGTVLERAMPRVSASARRTIDGKIKVAVQVKVDPSGKVTEAKLISPGPSQYFARLALEAAREWKFSPPEQQGQAVVSEWTLRFGYRRSGTDVVSTQTAP